MLRSKTINYAWIVTPVVANWPGQLFIRKAITYLHNPNTSSMISPQAISFVPPIIGHLHVSFNTREQIIKIYYSFFERLFHFVFGKWKVLAQKPRPWMINLLLELAFTAWIKMKKHIITKFYSMRKNTEYQIIIDTLYQQLLMCMLFFF